MNKRKLLEGVAHEVTKHLVDEGKLIEAGFAAYRHMVIPKTAGPVQIDECQLAFMAGAEHLWSSVMSFVDEGTEPTDKDMERMAKVQAEMDAWRAKLSDRVMPPKGST